MENKKETKIIRGTMMAMISILFLSFMMCFSTNNASAQKLLTDTANSLRTGSLPQQPLDIQYDETGMILEIPSLSVSADIVVAPFIDGEYSVYWLGDTAGLLEGTALPGEGPSVIAAHNHLSGNEAGPFVMLQYMNQGDKIFVMDKRGAMQSFTVYANTKIAETDVSGLIDIATGHDRPLILLTCEDERVEGGYANRRIIAAEPN